MEPSSPVERVGGERRQLDSKIVDALKPIGRRYRECATQDALDRGIEVAVPLPPP
jgi:hypothetical protein